MKNPTAIVKSRKYDGATHRTWRAEVVEQTAARIELVGVFEHEINHEHLGFIRRGTVSREFFWFERWYNIFLFYEPGGEFRNFYCNAAMPPVWKNNVLEYVDLDVDVVVWKNFSYQILDLDEFEANAEKFLYPQTLRSKVRDTVGELVSMIETRAFPFNYKL